MSYKLPDGTEVDCTLIQARRVWEFCKTRRDVSCEVLGDAILIRSRDATDVALNKRAELITLDGQVFDRVLGWYNNPPPPMESEKPPEVSEFHRGVISAIEAVWKCKFTEALWTWEVQDILARAAADGKTGGLRTLLEAIVKADLTADMALDALYTLRPTQPKPTTEFTLNYCRGKLDAIKVVWAGRFSRALWDEHLDLLIDAMRKDVTSVDRFLKSLASGMGCEGLRAELDRLRSGK